MSIIESKIREYLTNYTIAYLITLTPETDRESLKRMLQRGQHGMADQTTLDFLNLFLTYSKDKSLENFIENKTAKLFFDHYFNTFEEAIEGVNKSKNVDDVTKLHIVNQILYFQKNKTHYFPISFYNKVSLEDETKLKEVGSGVKILYLQIEEAILSHNDSQNPE